MEEVEIYRYPYGNKFEYIPVGMTDKKLLVCVVDEYSYDFMEILPFVHELVVPHRYISSSEAIRLLNIKLSLLTLSPNLHKHLNISDIEDLVLEKINKLH